MIYVLVQPMTSKPLSFLRTLDRDTSTFLSTERGLGRLSLVSLGVGDPDHITLRALERIREADYILGLPHLVENYAELLDGKQLVDAGHGLFSSLGQEGKSAEDYLLIKQREAELSYWIRQQVKAGQNIVILEMGDPCFFGPQLGYFQAFADLRPELVPGISSINAANAALAKPLLGKGRSVHISHWKALEKVQHQTLSDIWVLFCMGLDLEQVFDLLHQLYPPEFPVSLVTHAGFQQQQVILGTLTSLAVRLEQMQLPWECLIYLGVSADAQTTPN